MTPSTNYVYCWLRLNEFYNCRGIKFFYGLYCVLVVRYNAREVARSIAAERSSFDQQGWCDDFDSESQISRKKIKNGITQICSNVFRFLSLICFVSNNMFSLSICIVETEYYLYFFLKKQQRFSSTSDLDHVGTTYFNIFFISSF